MSGFEQFWNVFLVWAHKVDWRGLYEEIRNVGIGFNFVLIAGFIYSLIKAYKVRPKLLPLRKLKQKSVTLKSQAMKDTWAKLIARARQSPPQSLTIGIIEADSFADEALKRIGLKGDHMADRLEKISPDDVRSLSRLWQAHRIRNDLVHTPGFVITPDEAERVLQTYEEFLREIGAI